MLLPLIYLAKVVNFISKKLSLGSGGTWPGEIALIFHPHIFQYFASKFSKGIILVAGTNGKTTTSLMIKKVLEFDNQRVIHNDSGANLLNGLVSACIKFASWNGSFQADYGVFEVDENSLPHILYELRTHHFKNLKLIIVLLNLFRDQLDRYGEVDVIAEKWDSALRNMPKDTKLVLNADDPLIAHLGKAVSLRPGLEAGVVYFGLEDPKLFQKKMDHATDSIFCLNCGARLTYDGIYFSHIGIWKCPKCGEKRPRPNLNTWKSTLPGLYNMYNTLAAVSLVKNLGFKDSTINQALSSFTPAFGRQEEFEIDSKNVKIFLSKNPVGFNESLKTILELGASQILIVLNDRIPDGRDVSWIWDVDFEMMPDTVSVIVSGDRVYDLALRIKYAIKTQNLKLPPSPRLRRAGKTQNQNLKPKIYKNLGEAVGKSLDRIMKNDTLYILATYSAMLEVRRILIGRKIL